MVLLGVALPFDFAQGPRSRRVSLPQPNLQSISKHFISISLLSLCQDRLCGFSQI